MAKLEVVLLGFAGFGLLACTMTNPAFDDDQGGNGDGASSSEGRETGDPGDGDGAPGDGDGAPGDGDGDGAPGDGDGAPGDGDGEPACELFRPALQFVVDPPAGDACPAGYGELFLSVPLDGLNQPSGFATGIKCADSTCDGCLDATYAVGVPGFSASVDLWTTLEDLATAEAFEALCLHVTAIELVDEANGACVYDSMAIADNTLEHGPVFIGRNDAAPLTWLAGEALANLGLPSLAGEALSCTCAGVFGDSDDAGCCSDTKLLPKFYELSFLDAQIAPDESASVSVFEVPWEFYAARGQAVPSCGNLGPKPEISWALARLE